MKYRETKSYQNLSDNQKLVLDHADSNGIYGGIRSGLQWKEKHDHMTPEEIEEMKQKDQLNEWTSKWALIGIGVAVTIFSAILVIGEVTGNPMIPY